MPMDKDDFEQLDKRLKSIIGESVEEIEVSTDLPPTTEQLKDNNQSYLITAAVLFIDIRRSTLMTENNNSKDMVKVYRSFMRMAVDCVRKNEGVTRQFSGDRIMAIFIDSKDQNEAIVEKAVDKAVNAARSLQTAIDYSLNKYLRSMINGNMIECGIGIDYGEVLVTQIGMYGVEKDKNKEDEVDCAWIGKATNNASKLADIAVGGEIFISNEVYNQITEESKKKFVESAQYKDLKLFKGYVACDYYMDFAKDLGESFKIAKDNIADQENNKQLAEGVKEIGRLQNSLIQREKELAVLKEKLENENAKLNKELKEEKDLRIKENDEKEATKKQLKLELENTYHFVKEIIGGSFCGNYDYIKSVGIEMWLKIDKFYHELGEMQGYNKDQINNDAFEFIEIYAYFNRYDLSYDYMVSMAKENNVWVYINEATFRWACKRYRGHEVIDLMEDNLQNDKISYREIKDYEEKINMLKRIRGF